MEVFHRVAADTDTGDGQFAADLGMGQRAFAGQAQGNVPLGRGIGFVKRVDVLQRDGVGLEINLVELVVSEPARGGDGLICRHRDLQAIQSNPFPFQQGLKSHS